MMFVTRSHLALPTSHRLAPHDAHFWRTVGLVSQQPWFVATFRIGHGSYARQETICISWASDLLMQVEASPASQLVDLQCLIPPRRSPNANWATRPIAEIWVATHCGAQIPIFVDHNGEEFCSELLDWQVEDLKERRLVRVVAGRSVYS